MKNKRLLLLFIFLTLGCSKGKDDCVKFSEKIPTFDEREMNIFGKYFPQMAEADPSSFVHSYLTKIDTIKNGYTFWFSSLEHLRAYECGDLISMVMDGGFSVRVDVEKETMTWGNMESAKDGQKFKFHKK
ncbi:MAG: hypothetical protein JWO30_622 [Fibrobacteres bacterium]|nr:hypothetical protein [Fibrobacterota bacterium]